MDTVATPPRGRPRSPDADRAIASAAVALMGERGYADLTMAGVAARAGVSTATLYRRFASKEELIASALEIIIDPQPAADTGSLEGDLREILSRAAEKMSGESGAFLVGLAGELLRHPRLAAEVRARLTMPMRDSLAEVLTRAVARGEIPAPQEPEVVLALVLGPLHYRLLVSGEPIEVHVVDQVIPLLLRALGA